MARKSRGGLVWLIVLVVGAGIINAATHSIAPVRDQAPPQQFSSSEPTSPASLLGAPVKSVLPTSAKPKVLYVTATTLNVRVSPDAAGAILLKATKGTSVVAVGQRSGWYEVKLTNGATGWMSAAYLSETAPTIALPASPPAPTTKSPSDDSTTRQAKRAFERAAVVSAIIASSIGSYPGACPCPYNTMRNGRACGGRSAYSKPGGYAPLCYPRDVTDEMIDEYLARR